MADETFTFDEDGAARIVDAVRQVEKTRLGPTAKSSVRGGPRGNSVCVVRVTSTTPSSGLYPAKWEYYSGGAWSDGGDAWAIGANGNTPAVDRYIGVLIGVGSDGSPLFSIDDVSGLEVKDVSGFPDYTSVTKLIFATAVSIAYGLPVSLTLSQPGAGQAELTLNQSPYLLLQSGGTGTSPFSGSSEQFLELRMNNVSATFLSNIVLWPEGIQIGSGYTGGICMNGSLGISASVDLAKLTGGGSNGSATFVKGILTAYTAPT